MVYEVRGDERGGDATTATGQPTSAPRATGRDGARRTDAKPTGAPERRAPGHNNCTTPVAWRQTQRPCTTQRATCRARETKLRRAKNSPRRRREDRDGTTPPTTTPRPPTSPPKKGGKGGKHGAAGAHNTQGRGKGRGVETHAKAVGGGGTQDERTKEKRKQSMPEHPPTKRKQTKQQQGPPPPEKKQKEGSGGGGEKQMRGQGAHPTRKAETGSGGTQVTRKDNREGTKEHTQRGRQRKNNAKPEEREGRGNTRPMPVREGHKGHHHTSKSNSQARRAPATHHQRGKESEGQKEGTDPKEVCQGETTAKTAHPSPRPPPHPPKRNKNAPCERRARNGTANEGQQRARGARSTRTKEPPPVNERPGVGTTSRAKDRSIRIQKHPGLEHSGWRRMGLVHPGPNRKEEPRGDEPGLDCLGRSSDTRTGSSGWSAPRQGRENSGERRRRRHPQSLIIRGRVAKRETGAARRRRSGAGGLGSAKEGGAEGGCTWIGPSRRCQGSGTGSS